MEKEQIGKLAVILGVSEEELERALEALGGVEHFYYDPNVFRGLLRVNCNGLRKLVVPDLSRLRRLW